MEADYANRYQQLYESHWWWRAREEFIVSSLRESIPKGSQRAVLDIGCGNGLFFDRLAEFGDVEGIEADASIVTDDGRHRDRIHVGPFTSDYETEKRYGLILMLDILEHLPNPSETLRRALDLLEDDGVILITVPAFNLLWTEHDDLNHHLVRYTKRLFSPVAAEAGLRVERKRYFFHWMFPAKLAVRLKEMFFRSADKLPGIPSLPINRTLYGVSRIEERFFRKLPIPFGSSLLIVGRKSASGVEPQ